MRYTYIYTYRLMSLEVMWRSLAEASSGCYSFGLIDFGLAVDARAWKCGAWCRSGASGDGRFWPTSAWRMFTGEALDEDLRAEYSAHLDLHSIGLSALQALVTLAFWEDMQMDAAASEAATLCVYIYHIYICMLIYNYIKREDTESCLGCQGPLTPLRELRTAWCGTQDCAGICFFPFV